MCIRDRCYHLSKYLARFLRVKHLTPCAVSRLPGSCPVPSDRRVSGDPCRPGSLRACRKCPLFTHSITRRAKKGEEVIRYSRYLMPTTKETPSDAEVVSHRLMLRAGLLRKVASGIYNLSLIHISEPTRLRRISYAV